jgi:uncharacterized protein YbjT (DUF2867 family)
MRTNYIFECENEANGMKVLVFGATGMVGRGVLRECLLDQGVERVISVGRSGAGVIDAKLHEILRDDLADLSPIESRLTGLDACFYCLGVSSAGMSEADYDHVTFGLTIAAAHTLSRLNPGMTFVYVSGQGTDSTEKGRTMWARVKGKTENAILRLPLKAFMFRPGIIQPLDGIRSRTTLYRIGYILASPLLPLLRRAFPDQVLTTRDIGRAMLAVARKGYGKRVLETADIRAVASSR